MKIERKRFVCRKLRRLLDWLDEWLHAWEVELRGHVEPFPIQVCVESPRAARTQGPTVSCPYPFPEDELLQRRIRGRVPRSRQPQRAAQNHAASVSREGRRHVTAADFDRRFA